MQLQEADGTKSGETAIIRDLSQRDRYVNIAEIYADTEPKAITPGDTDSVRAVNRISSCSKLRTIGDLSDPVHLPDLHPRGAHPDQISLTYPKRGTTKVVVANYQRKAITLPKGTRIGIAELLEVDVITPPSVAQPGPPAVLPVDGSAPEGGATSTPPGLEEAPRDVGQSGVNPRSLKEETEADLAHLNPAKASRVKKMLTSLEDIRKGGALGTIGATQHCIDLMPGARPARSQPHWAGPIQGDNVDGEANRMLQAGVIRGSMSEWGAPVVLIPKKNSAPRFCIDYRRLNLVTKKDSYPLPSMDASTPWGRPPFSTRSIGTPGISRSRWPRETSLRQRLSLTVEF